MPLPRKLLEQGVRDMVRISDARMSGTAFGTVVLHVAPESSAGGPLALVRDGDWVVLDVEGGWLDFDLPIDEIEARRLSLAPFVSPHDRGWYSLYVDSVLGAETGADLAFLRGGSGSEVPRESH